MSPFNRLPSPQERGQRQQDSSSDYLQQARERMEAGARQREQLKTFMQQKDALFGRGRAVRKKLESNAQTGLDKSKWQSHFEGFNAETLQIVNRIRGNEGKLSQPRMAASYEQYLDGTEQVLREYEQNLQGLEALLNTYEQAVDIPPAFRFQQRRPPVSSWRGETASTNTGRPVEKAASPAGASAMEQSREAGRRNLLDQAERRIKGLEQSWETNGVIKLPDGPLYDRQSGRSLRGSFLLEAQKEALHRAALTHALRVSLRVPEASIPAILGEPKSYMEQQSPGSR